MSTHRIQEFSQRLISTSRHVSVYENPSLQTKAKAIVPLSELLSRAKERCQLNETQHLRDALLVELLDWFKNDFFSWFDAASCRICEKPMDGKGNGVPTAEEVRHGAHRVELYQCAICQATERFPRYNNPGTGSLKIMFNFIHIYMSDFQKNCLKQDEEDVVNGPTVLPCYAGHWSMMPGMF